MALTPDDIVNMSFETTRFRDGYDQDQVDDYLDEVVAEFRSLVAENEQLKARVQELETELERVRAAGPETVAMPAPEADAQSQEPVEAEVVEVAEVDEAAAPAEAPAGVEADASAAASLLARAGRLHDEHVAEGVARRDQLIAEAEDKARAITVEAEERQAQSLAKYEEKKANIEAKIDELKTFERDYRLKLRGYIESQLRDLDRSSSLAFGGQNS